MKSLEIANLILKSDTRGFVDVNILKQIKQDLEVLEILRKYIYLDQQCYDYDWEDGGCWIDYLDIKDIDDIDEHYQEDFKKIKQWLEENE